MTQEKTPELVALKKKHRFDKVLYEANVNKDNKRILKDYLLEMKSKGKAQSTIKQYDSDIKSFLCWLIKEDRNTSILKLKKRAFRDYFLEKQDIGLSAARINRIQCSLRNLLEFCNEDDDDYEDYEVNVMRAVKGLRKEQSREIIFLEDFEIKKILEVLEEREEYQKALYLSLSYDSAGRRNEMFQVTKDSFSSGKPGRANEVQGKRGKKYRPIFLKNTARLAKLWLEQRGDDEIESIWLKRITPEGEKIPATYEDLYGWVYTMRDIYMKEFEEESRFNPHSFRHSSLENYANGSHSGLKELGYEKLPIEVLKALANHDSIDTTQSYLKDKSEELLDETFKIK